MWQGTCESAACEPGAQLPMPGRCRPSPPAPAQRSSARPSSVPTSSAIRRTASKSPGDAIGKPASMMSTPMRANCRAISSFSSMFSVAPGDCSPSRRVVSKMRTTSGIRTSLASRKSRSDARPAPRYHAYAPPAPGLTSFGFSHGIMRRRSRPTCSTCVPISSSRTRLNVGRPVAFSSIHSSA